MAEDGPDDLRQFLRELGVQGPKRPGWLIAAGAVVFVVLVAAFTAFYRVPTHGEGVLKRFGRVVGAPADPGLHLKLPFGIDQAYFVPTKRVLKEEFGYRTRQPARRSSFEKTPAEEHESLMLTGDLNVIDVEWVVQYGIHDPVAYLHRVREPRETLRDISEAVMRRIVGNSYARDVLTQGRVEVAAQVQREMQRILHSDDPGSYNMGVTIKSVEMQDVTPPDEVKPAFNEVNEARQEKERLINEAKKKRNQVIPRVEGQAKQIVAEAKGYADERTNLAQGEAARFRALLDEYEGAPEVTRRRLYIETMDQVLGQVDKIYVVEPGQTSPLPLLNLPEATRAAQPEKREGS